MYKNGKQTSTSALKWKKNKKIYFINDQVRENLHPSAPHYKFIFVLFYRDNRYTLSAGQSYEIGFYTLSRITVFQQLKFEKLH